MFNISKLCRLCLLKEGTMSAIFDEKKSATADRIMACVSIEVSFLCVKFWPVVHTFAQHKVVAGAPVTTQLCSQCLRFTIHVDCFS
jgi:hypothetical protein